MTEHVHVVATTAIEVEHRGTASGTNKQLYWVWAWGVCSCGHGPMNKQVLNTVIK